MKPSSNLERLLSAPPYLDDDGFTGRVMARVPESNDGARSRRSVILAVSACAALVAAAIVPGSRAAVAAVRDLLEPLLTLPLDPVRSGAALASMGTTALTVDGVVLAMIVWGAVALARGEAH